MTTALERVVERARTAAAPVPPAPQPVAPMQPAPDNASVLADLQDAVAELSARVDVLEAQARDDALAEMDVAPAPMAAAVIEET